MKKAKILLSFTKLSDANLDVKAHAILIAMTGNTHFSDIQPTLEAFETAVKNFSEAMAASQTRDKVNVVAKKNMRRTLLQVLTDMAAYINYHGNGDRLSYTSSGFDVSAEFKSARKLVQPDKFTVVPGNFAGEVWVSVSPLKGAQGYLYFYAEAPVANNAWQHVPGDGATFMITGLDPLKLYSFRVGISGSRGQMVYTDIITRVV